MATLSRSHLLRRFEKYNIDEWRDSDKIEDFEVRFVNETKGKGLFSRRKFEKNDFLLFYRGEKISSKRYDELIRNGKNEYVFANLTHKLYIDATEETSGLARFINDCGDDKPNAKAKVHTDVNGQRHIKIVCERPINAGEEITYDYQGEFMPWRKPKSRKRKISESETASTLEVNQSDVEEIEPPLTQEELRHQQELIGEQKRKDYLNMEAETIESNDEEDSVDDSEDLFEGSDENCHESEPPSPPPLHPKPSFSNNKPSEPEPVMINFPLQKRGQRTVEKPHARVRQPPEVSNPPVYPSTASLKKSCSKDKPQATTSLQLVGSITPTNYPNDLFLCLHCNFPMTEAHEMIEHQIECGTRPFKGKTEIVDGKRKHYFLYCTECSALCNRTHFPSMKAHIESVHCKELKCGETYLFFRVDEETEALDVSHSKVLCSNPLEHISPEDQDYEHPIHQLSEESSNELDDEAPTDSRRQLILKNEDTNKLYQCQFCGDSVSWYRSLRRHFEIVHGVKDRKVLSLFQKCHLLALKPMKSRKRFLCTADGCLRLVADKRKHKEEQPTGSYQHPHEPVWQTVNNVWQLPKELTQLAAISETDEQYLTEKTYDFVDFLAKYKIMKEEEMRSGTNSTFTKSNINGKLQKLKQMVIATKGMTEPRRIQDWIKLYPHVTASKTVLNMLLDLQNFIDHFLIQEIGSFQQRIDVMAFKGQIKLLRSNESRRGRSRKQILKTTAGNSLPQPKEVRLLREKILEYLKKKLSEDLTDILESEFRTLTFNIMAILTLRNSARSGTISLFRTEFLDNRDFCESLQLYAIELAPKELNDLRKGPGERKRIEEMQKMLQRTHKNFYCEGVKMQALSAEEMQIVDDFAKLRQKLGKSHQYIFAPLNAPSDLHYESMKSYGKNWARSLPKQHNMPHLKINSTQYRKLMATSWKENISSTLHREALNQHTGHTEETAATYYEVALNKKRNAAVASHYTDLVLNQGLEQDANPTVQGDFGFDEPGPSTRIIPGFLQNQEADDSDISGISELPPSSNGAESELEVETQSSDVEVSSAENVPPTHFPRRVPVSYLRKGNKCSTSRLPMNLEEIAGMIRNRVQRTGRQKYVLDQDNIQTLAELYVQFVQGTRNFSALFRSRNLLMNIDAAKSIFRQISTMRHEKK